MEEYVRRLARNSMVALLLLALVSCAASQPTPEPTRLRFQPNPTQAPLTLAEAQDIVRGAGSAHRIRWHEYIGGHIFGWEASYSLTLNDTVFLGQLKTRTGEGVTQTLALQSPSDGVEPFLADVRATTLVEGAHYLGDQQFDNNHSIVFELTTQRGLVFFVCPDAHTNCPTWNVWVSINPPVRDRFPRQSVGTHFLVTGPQVSASLERLHQVLGVDTIRKELERSR